MAKVQVAFQVMDDKTNPPPTFQEIGCHLIYDVKMEDFQRKARLVAGGHMTDSPPAHVMYASVVSRESVRIALTLNDLEVKTANIENAYLTAPVGEKIWCRLGPEFGENAGKKAIIVRALYGLKSAGASFRNHLADCMRHLGWESCKADPDVWMKPEVRKDDGYKYYAYCLLYVDDILVVHHDGLRALQEIDHYFKTKPGSIRDPEFYLGAKLRLYTLPNGVQSWAMSSSKYIQAAVQNVKAYHAANFPSRQWSKRSKAHSHSIMLRNWTRVQYSTQHNPHSIRRKLECCAGASNWGVLISSLRFLNLPHTLYNHARGIGGRIPRFQFLEKKHNARIVFDPSYPLIDMSSFKVCNWKEYYGDVTEAIPPNAPLHAERKLICACSLIPIMRATNARDNHELDLLCT
ncbi:hypothetical protein MHU86_19978 [Fragilaria crotonensis]|nr:hypothetical protein MHU86_19978 [Fragilaria crotonensis]